MIIILWVHFILKSRPLHPLNKIQKDWYGVLHFSTQCYMTVIPDRRVKDGGFMKEGGNKNNQFVFLQGQSNKPPVLERKLDQKESEKQSFFSCWILLRVAS